VTDDTRGSPFLPLDRPLVLASSSPRRAEILREAGVPFTVMEPRVSEEAGLSLGAAECAVELALRKAREIAPRVAHGLVLAADTVVVVDGVVLGKPGSPAEARGMLHRLSGRTHEVITGVALISRPEESEITDLSRTLVALHTMSGAAIDAYVSSGEPLDKAGAYAIQGAMASAVDRIDGCYFNVVGLPLSRVAAMIARMERSRAR